MTIIFDDSKYFQCSPQWPTDFYGFVLVHTGTAEARPNAQAYNHSIWDVVPKESREQDHPWLHSTFRASLSYMTLFHLKKNHSLHCIRAHNNTLNQRPENYGLYAKSVQFPVHINKVFLKQKHSNAISWDVSSVTTFILQQQSPVVMTNCIAHVG